MRHLSWFRELTCGQHMIVDIIRIYEGLVEYRDTPAEPYGPTGFFNDASQWSFVYKNLIYTLQTLVGDGVVVRPHVRSSLIISSSTSCSDISMFRPLAIMVDHRLSHHVMDFSCR